MASQFPARLHALLAAEAPVGVVLRRGPARAVCSILWDRVHDRFTLGQWVRARIYERRCDLSPDGRHLIYFARAFGRAPETRGTWTAIARAPWLRAIALHGKGDCWQGGGLFTSNTTYWLNGGCCHFPVRDNGELTIDAAYRPPDFYGGECPGVYYPRLQRDGWVLRERLSAGKTSDLAIFEKPLPQGWLLRKYCHADAGPRAPGRNCYWDEHELEHPGAQLRIVRREWEWAERDGDTLVWAEGGCLHRALLNEAGLCGARVLHDFNGMRFEALAAPY